jgi:hypothetical protein
VAIAQLQPIWEAALADAELELAAARLYPFAGAPPEAQGHAAAWYRPGEHLHWHLHHPFDLRQLDDANLAAHVGLHRISVFAGARLLPIEGWIRHEIQHAVQWNLGGAALWDLRFVVDDALGQRVGGIAGGPVLYNLIPSESNANGAARRFLVDRHGVGVIDDLLGSFASALVREVETERGAEGSGLQHTCFAAIYAEETAEACETRRTNLDELLPRVDAGAKGLWDALRGDEQFQQLRRQAKASEPSPDIVALLEGTRLFEAWAPARDAVQTAMRCAYGVAGL